LALVGVAALIVAALGAGLASLLGVVVGSASGSSSRLVGILRLTSSLQLSAGCSALFTVGLELLFLLWMCWGLALVGLVADVAAVLTHPAAVLRPGELESAGNCSHAVGLDRVVDDSRAAT
jgi:hypothetical protein